MLGFKENFIGKNFARHHFEAVNAVSNILRRLFSEIQDSFKKISILRAASRAVDPLPDRHTDPPSLRPPGPDCGLTWRDSSIAVCACAVCNTSVLEF